jgi:hypothetical protein
MTISIELRLLKESQNLFLKVESLKTKHSYKYYTECHNRGLIEKYQDLGVKARVYFQERFTFMDHKTILGYLELFKELGMLFDDKEIMLLMKPHLAKSFH